MYVSWIYNQCLSPLMLWVWFLIRVRCTTLCDKVCQWLAAGQWFSPGPPVSSINKTDLHDITEILLKVALNTIKHTNKQSVKITYSHHDSAKIFFTLHFNNNHWITLFDFNILIVQCLNKKMHVFHKNMYWNKYLTLTLSR